MVLWSCVEINEEIVMGMARAPPSFVALYNIWGEMSRGE
jgi:hypothetical protein